MLLFTPQKFFAHRFLLLSSKKISYMSYMAVFLGIFLGNIISFMLTQYLIKDLAQHPDNYKNAAAALNGNIANFQLILESQHSYSIILMLISPLIAFMAHHILGGALYIFLLVTSKPYKINLEEILLCVKVSLIAMIWYVIPGLGPLCAIIAISMNLSKALYIKYQMYGLIKNVSIFLAMYISFVLSSATLQMIAMNTVKLYQ